MKKTGHRVLFIHTWPKLLIISCKKGWTNWVNLGFQILEHKIHKHTSKRGIKKMPCIYISTNLNLDGIDTDPIFSEVTTAISTIIGRPEKVIFISLTFSLSVFLFMRFFSFVWILCWLDTNYGGQLFFFLISILFFLVDFNRMIHLLCWLSSFW
jgi:hypothetical protein